MPRKTKRSSAAASQPRCKNSPALPACLPEHLCQEILQCLSVADAAELNAVQRQAQDVFKRIYNVRFFVVFSKPARLGGCLKLDLNSTLEETSATSSCIMVSAEVPLDWASSMPKGLAADLKDALLPMAASAATVVGIAFKKPRGKSQEFKNSLGSLDPLPLEIVSETDFRAGSDMPQDILMQSSLKVLHCDHPTAESVSKFSKAPEALCSSHATWPDILPHLPSGMKTIGDLCLHADGLYEWQEMVVPVSFVHGLGVSITTHGRQATWTPASILRSIMVTFPSLKRISLNMEFTYGHDANDEVLFQLVHALVAARITLVFGEVVLVKLPSSVKKRDARLAEIRERLGILVSPYVPKVRAKTAKETPLMSFRLPAVCALCLPNGVSESVADALWSSVW